MATNNCNSNNSNNNNNNNNNNKNNSNHMSIPTDILDDLSTRFIINMPKELRNDLIRICFQLELGHWFYLDFLCETQPLLPRLNYTRFSHLIFTHIPFLNQFLPELDAIINKWKEYKSSVPTCGAILLDSSLEHVLLVQGFGAKSWGFPKGKINEKEPFVACAAREVKEETGYDCSDCMKEGIYLERRIRDTSVRLYIVSDVDKDYAFKPLARNEIKDIQWFAVNELPVRTHDMIHSSNYANKFFTVCPFVKPLRQWIANERQTVRHSRGQDNKNGHSLAIEDSNRFWAKSWDNIKFDWNRIWSDIYKDIN